MVKGCHVQVLINDYPVNFEFENEKNVSDIVHSISDWSRERDLIFYELYLDENLYSIDKVPDAGLDGVGVINCIVQSKADIVISSIDEAVRYCDRVSSFLKQVIDSGTCTGNDIEDLASGTSWLLEVLNKTMGLLGHAEHGFRHKDRDISYYIDIIEAFRDSLGKDGDEIRLMSILTDHKELFLEIKHIFKMFLLSDAMRSLIVQSIDSPDVLINSLIRTKDEFPDQLSNLQAAAVAYQMGRDSEGAEGLKKFVDFVYRYIRTCYQIVPVFRIELSEVESDGVTLEDKNSELRHLLHEVITVMENNDIISLSDILEYEISPALGKLDTFLNLLLEKISFK
jgi:hypothetical protein